MDRNSIKKLENVYFMMYTVITIYKILYIVQDEGELYEC